MRVVRKLPLGHQRVEQTTDATGKKVWAAYIVHHIDKSVRLQVKDTRWWIMDNYFYDAKQAQMESKYAKDVPRCHREEECFPSWEQVQ